jgi:hypothetical protein
MSTNEALRLLSGNLASIIPPNQRAVIRQLLEDREEAGYFINKLVALDKLLSTAPVTYEQSSAGDDAVVHFHFFGPGADFYITELDSAAAEETPSRHHQAFGYASMRGVGELGYISIPELHKSGLVELDLHWSPKTLREIQIKR